MVCLIRARGSIRFLTIARLLSLASMLVLIILSFVGGLVSGLGQGFDLGIEWPSEPVRLLRALLQGSLEALHRILTVLAAPLVLAMAIASYRLGLVFYISLAGVALLIATSITGRMILLTLGGYIGQPIAPMVYSFNNLFATLAIGSASLVYRMLASGMISMAYGEKRIPMILHRGAAGWGIIASFIGAYMLGYTKTTQNPLPRDIFSLSISSPIDLIVKLHIVSGALAVILTIIATIARRSRDPWSLTALIASIAQPAAGLILLSRVSTDPWSPGVFLAIHLILAQLIVIGNGVPYMAYLLGRKIVSGAYEHR